MAVDEHEHRTGSGLGVDDRRVLRHGGSRYARIVESPVNVVGVDAPPLARLAEVAVARISFAGFLMNQLYGAHEARLAEISAAVARSPDSTRSRSVSRELERTIKASGRRKRDRGGRSVEDLDEALEELGCARPALDRLPRADLAAQQRVERPLGLDHEVRIGQVTRS
jgi:hypothetical protein